MSEHEHPEHLLSQREIEEAQRKLELAQNWDDETRREAVRMNRQGSDEPPMSFEQAIDFLFERRQALAAAADEAVMGDEEDEFLRTAARRIGRNLSLTEDGDIDALRNLIAEVESNLASSARLQSQLGEGPMTLHEFEEIQRLRQTRDALFEKYDQTVTEQHGSIAEGAEQMLRGTTNGFEELPESDDPPENKL